MPPRPQAERTQTLIETQDIGLVGLAQTFADREVGANKQLPKNADSPLSQELVATFIDSALEAGIDQDFTIENPDDKEKVARNRHIRTALSWASVQALRTLDEKVARAQTDKERQVAEEDRDVTQEGTQRLFELFGITTRPTEEKVVTREIPVIRETGEQTEKPIHIRAMEAMNGIDREVSKSYEGMAVTFADVYMSGQSKIDGLRDIFGQGSRYSKAEQVKAEQEFMQTITSMNVYSHRLSNILHAIDDPAGQRGYVNKLQKTMAEIVQGKSAVDPNTPEQILFNQMITGISLEVASTRVLKQAANRYGWSDVRGSTIKEDVKEQTDVFIVVNGQSVPLDIKSSRSFTKQRGYDINVDGIKIKKAKDGTKVIVVDAQWLGNPDRYNDVFFEFEDGEAVVQAVNQAVKHLTHHR